MVGKGGRRGRRLSLTRTPALFPLFRLRFLHRGRVAQTKGSTLVFVNKALTLRNSKSGFECVTEELFFLEKKCVPVIGNTKNSKIISKTHENLQSLVGARNTAAMLGAILVIHQRRNQDIPFKSQTSLKSNPKSSKS